MDRAMRFELTTSTLARLYFLSELRSGYHKLESNNSKPKAVAQITRKNMVWIVLIQKNGPIFTQWIHNIKHTWNEARIFRQINSASCLSRFFIKQAK